MNITRDHAAGMLKALKAHHDHDCATAIVGQSVLGDGRVLDLRCPYGLLDVDSEVDRRVITTVYAHEARSVLSASNPNERN